VPPLAAEGTVAVMVKTFALVAVCTVCAVMEIAIQAFHFNNVLAVVGTPALGVPGLPAGDMDLYNRPLLFA